MIDLDTFELRDLQKEAARALSVIEATNDNIYQFNMAARHNSQNWYKKVIEFYIEQYGDLPSKVGPGKDIKLVSE
jgi:hypothetical protein